VINGEPIDLVDELGSAVILYGGGLGFTFPAGDADVSIGLNAYSLQFVDESYNLNFVNFVHRYKHGQSTDNPCFNFRFFSSLCTNRGISSRR
jgi:hypothetical protein